MKQPRLGLYIYSFTLIMTLTTVGDAHAQDSKFIIRLVKLKVDPTQLDAFKTALKDEIQTSIRVEPGVLTLNVVEDKQNPTDITLLEVYSDDDAYKKHLVAPHFEKYKAATKDMIKSRDVLDASPIFLWSKPE